MPRQAPQFGWIEIRVTLCASSRPARQAPQFGWIEIRLVVQVGTFMRDTAFLFRMVGYPPDLPPLQI